MSNHVHIAIVIPSFNEIFALPVFLKELSKSIDKNFAIIVMDDSDPEIAKELEKITNLIGQSNNAPFIYVHNPLKSGRGNAVRRGFEFALSEFQNLSFVIECDADGSHRAEDVIALSLNSNKKGVVIGSRYLKESKIIGWPLSRLAFSKLLNLVIPRILGLQLTDVTNGLRIYSKESVNFLCSIDQQHVGFIYLSESIQVLTKNGYDVREIPSVFINRTLGKSTVRFSEVVKSLKGIIMISKTK